MEKEENELRIDWKQRQTFWSGHWLA